MMKALSMNKSDFLAVSESSLWGIPSNSVGQKFLLLNNESVKLFDDGYVSPVAQVTNNVSGVDKWYIYIDASWTEIDPEQLWYWTKEWQAGEQRAEKDLELGQYEDFDNVDDFFNAP